jgi:hypothetical protein
MVIFATNAMLTKSIQYFSVPVGVFFLINGTGANALIPTQIISQAPGSVPDVIIDTGNTYPSNPSPPNSPPSNSSSNNGPRFSCQFVNGQYAVMYNPESQPNRYYPWAVPRAMGDGWTPERRCQEISNRLESYRPDGLVEPTTGWENSYDILCVTTQKIPSCRILLTVPRGQNALALRDQVFQNLVTAEQGQQTVPVNTFNGTQLGISSIFNSNKPKTPKGVNLRPFLDPSDGGTGDKLKRRNSVKQPPSQSN